MAQALQAAVALPHQAYLAHPAQSTVITVAPALTPSPSPVRPQSGPTGNCDPDGQSLTRLP